VQFSERSPYVELRDYLSNLKSDLNASWTIARQHWLNRQTEQTETLNIKAHPISLKPGDTVYVERKVAPPHMCKALYEKFSGPYTVVHVYGSIAKIVPQGKLTPIISVHLSRLKKQQREIGLSKDQLALSRKQNVEDNSDGNHDTLSAGPSRAPPDEAIGEEATPIQVENVWKGRLRPLKIFGIFNINSIDFMQE
jgi:hypothetical protein